MASVTSSSGAGSASFDNAALQAQASLRADNAPEHAGSGRNTGTSSGTTTCADVGPRQSPLLHRRAGSTIRAQLHRPDSPTSSSPPALPDLGPIAHRLPPASFEFDEDGKVKPESMPEHLGRLFEAAEHVRLDPPATLGFLADRAYATTFDVFNTASMATVAATNTIIEELQQARNALLNLPPLPAGAAADISTNTAATTARVYFAGAVIKNLIVSGALLYYKSPNTMQGWLKLAFFVATELSSAWANGSAFQHVGRAQSARDASRRLRENSAPDPRLPGHGTLAGEPWARDRAEAAILDDNKFALLETIHEKLTELRRNTPDLPQVDETAKALFIQCLTMAVEQLAMR